MASGGFLAGLGKMLDAGAAYLQHTQFAQRALAADARERGAMLAAYVKGLSEASYAGFKLTLAMQANGEQGERRAALQQLIDGCDAARSGAAPQVERAPQALQRRAPAAPAINDFDADHALFAHWFDDLDGQAREAAVLAHLRSLSRAAGDRFVEHLQRMSANLDEAIRRHQADENAAWGGSFEDRMAYGMARLRTGQRDPAWVRKLQELQSVKAFAEALIAAVPQVRTERETRTDRGVRAARPRAANQGEPEMSHDTPITPERYARIKQAVTDFTRSGHYPGGVEQMKADVTALVLSGQGDEVMKVLQDAGGTEGGDKVLQIQDHYKPGDGKLYTLRWPIEFPLPIPFDQLDRPTQFSVLWGEWSRREMEGSHTLLAGDPALARTIFMECVERAEQIDVPELIARAHEGVARACSQSNQRADERKHLKLAIEARKRT